MKKIFIFLLIAVLAFFVWYVYNLNFNSNLGQPPIDINKTSSQSDPSNATFIFDEGPITLKNGENEMPIVPGSAIVQETSLSSLVAEGDINGDNKEDSAVVLIQMSGGSGVFVYLAADVSGPISYKGTNAVFIGDRIKPESITIRNEIITLTYLDRNSNESFGEEPTVSITEEFIYRNGELVKR